MSAQRPWLSRVADLKDNTLYRPGTLNRVKAQLDSLNPTKFGLGQVAEGNSQFTMHQVKRGDQLRALARDLLGDPEKADLVFQENLDKLDSPDRIYPRSIGLTIRSAGSRRRRRRRPASSTP
jgi:hypothetical protein